jgi:glycosyltransferase involved in cell wall biosynthesis
MNICAIIPAYNEAKTIGYLTEEIKKKGIDVLVIDDGSSDATGRVAKEKGAVVLKNKKTIGKGASLRTGFDFIINRNYDGIITLDGDGQHDPDNISQLIEKVKKSDAKVVIGNRMCSTKNMPFIRWCTNKLMSCFISLICKQYIPDTQCGFRYISMQTLKSLELTTSNFEIETEVLIEASKKGNKIYSVPIRTIYQDQVSKINPFLDTLRFIRFIFRKKWISKK